MKNKMWMIAIAAILSLSVPHVSYAEEGHDEAAEGHAEEGHGDEHAEEGHGDEHAEEVKGPHNGRLLSKDDFAIEMTIFEDNAPPEFHVYAYKNSKPIKVQDVELSVTLKRLDGEVTTFSFAPDQDYLKSDKTVLEPHSFDVLINATYDGNKYQWSYESYEGRTQINADSAKQSGIATEEAGSALLHENITLSGQITLNANSTANIRARFPGIVRSVKKGLGDSVEAGETIAMIESNDSLQVYPVKAPIKGVILTRNTNIGDVAGEAPLFTIADLSTVWAEFHVFPGSVATIKNGQKVQVTNLEGTAVAEGEITSLLPVAQASTQTIVARVPLENLDGTTWRTGMNVQGKVIVVEREVPLAVKSSALQRFRDFTVVFAQVGDVYEVRMLELGQDDGTWTEVLSGLKPGTRYVTTNSFLIRADIEKSGASHDH